MLIEAAMSYFCCMISMSSNLLPYRSNFVLGNTEERHKVQGGENKEISALVGFCVAKKCCTS